MTVVIKLGGSLLDLPDLKQRLRHFIVREYARSPVLLLVGGGRIVDAVRQYDRIHHFESHSSHWLCVDLMTSTANMLQLLLSDWPVLRDPATLAQWVLDANKCYSTSSINFKSATSTQSISPAIVAPTAFYSQQINAAALPMSWECTSDSIAALLSGIACATELVMLKSRSKEDSTATDEPLLDAAFAEALPAGMKVRIVNLRQL